MSVFICSRPGSESVRILSASSGVPGFTSLSATS